MLTESGLYDGSNWTGTLIRKARASEGRGLEQRYIQLSTVVTREQAEEEEEEAERRSAAELQLYIRSVGHVAN
jgi:hypothetical protein